ncbi:MAG: cell division protein ZapA [Leptonema sp. (in: bacteria)]
MKTIEKTSKVDIDIFGLEFTFKSKEAEEDYIRILARYVDQKMKEISLEGGRSFSYNQLAILAAINIADELFQEKNKVSDTELIVSKTKQLIQLLDEGILGDPIL